MDPLLAAIDAVMKVDSDETIGDAESSFAMYTHCGAP